jgi:hypothetical protein
MVPGVKRNGKPRESNLVYIHKPKDGSNRSEWTFHQIRALSVQKAGVEELVRYMSRLLLRLSDRRKKSMPRQRIERTVRIVKLIALHIESDMKKSDAPIISTPAISV